MSLWSHSHGNPLHNIPRHTPAPPIIAAGCSWGLRSQPCTTRPQGARPGIAGGSPPRRASCEGQPLTMGYGSMAPLYTDSQDPGGSSGFLFNRDAMRELPWGNIGKTFIIRSLKPRDCRQCSSFPFQPSCLSMLPNATKWSNGIWSRSAMKDPCFTLK